MDAEYLHTMFTNEAEAALKWHGSFGGCVFVEIRDNILYLYREELSK